MSNLLFFRRSCSYRSAAVDLTRKARDLPLGPERRAVRQLARAFSDLAKTEAWLEGLIPRRGSPTYDRNIDVGPLARSKQLPMAFERDCSAIS